MTISRVYTTLWVVGLFPRTSQIKKYTRFGRVQGEKHCEVEETTMMALVGLGVTEFRKHFRHNARRDLI